MDQRRQLELKLDEDLTIDEGRHSQASDASASPRLDAARLLLAQGKWAEGFRDFERRAFVSPSDRPRWTGARLPAARLVVLAEDEECDTLAFARFLPELAARVLSLTLAAPAAQAARLAPFAGAFGGVPLVDTGCLPPHDLVLPLASAPMALGLSPDGVPPPRPAAWERRNGPTIGVALAASPWSRVGEAVPEQIVATLRRAFPDRRLVALDATAATLLGGGVVDADPLMLAGLELVVATDGPAAHAAGVTGSPLWLLLDGEPHWMWGGQGLFSRWYPAARLFRAEGPNWKGMADALAIETRALAAAGLSDVASLTRLAAAAEGVDGAPAARTALPLAARLVALNPSDPEAWARLAGLLLRLGETGDLDRVLDAGLSAGPHHAPLLLFAARRDLQCGRPVAALQHAEKALSSAPGSTDALRIRAAAFVELGELTKAEFTLRQAVQAAPRRAGLLVAWGEVLGKLGDGRGASRAFERAVIVGDDADARLGLGRLAQSEGETGLALHFLGSAVARDDGHTEAAMEFARVLSAAGRVSEAIGVLRRLIVHRPSPPIRAFLGELLLASGDFAAGLAEFEWRRGGAPALPSPAELAGRTIVLVAEGDAGVLIRLLRFIPTLKAAGAAGIRIAGADELAPLLASVHGLDGVGEPGEGDLVLPIMSVPALLGLSIGDLLLSQPYLTVDPVAVTNAARAFAHLDGFRVGFALDGINAADAAALTTISGAAFVALDAGAAAWFHTAWPLAADQVGLERIAAALPNLDVVVALASSPIAVLAGAMGRPTFVIGPDRDDWLWLEKDGRSPWFPTTRLFRRRTGEEKGAPLLRLTAALASFAAGDRAIPYRADPAPVDEALPDGDGSVRPSAMLAQAGIAASRSRNDYRAVLLLGDAIAAGATEPALRETLAAALLRIGERDRAGRLLAALVAETPTAGRLVELSEVDRLAGRLEEALAHAERAVELGPDLAEAHRAVGKALVALGRAGDALTAYGRALALAPADPELLMDEAEALLIVGDYRRGFARAEVRWQATELLPRRFSASRWTGEDVAGRTLLVHGERNPGLDIAFARFLPQLVACGPRLVVEVRPALTDLFRRLDLGGDVTVVEQGRRLPPHDLEVPLLSLPNVFGIERDGLPPPARFRPDPLRVEAWRRQLADGDERPAVGVYWRNADDAALLAPLARLAGVRLYALDRRAGRASLAALPSGLATESLGSRLGGFVEMAAAMMALDAVIAPVSATAHLAASLGRPTIVVAPAATDWLWAGENTTPWYPDARLLRRDDDLVGFLRGLVSERPAP
ncbi:tetratricopeptide repeat protein [Pleomorphomonas sp. T1.2MG-36]|uniref:tetratricopeptide repeat protein n=1 Tax=Pleomorphomonas sp. T1.2MG-36 TaxID=3041167 RepID=UPI00253FC386|nr:tetratricopeptide repeat protein [Pleomorphomonas sp. T1.2MG-36]